MSYAVSDLGVCRQATGLVVLLFAAMLSGCASGPKRAPLYQWGEVPEVLFQDLTQVKSPQEQLNVLQGYVAALQVARQPIPPGVRMHMALLHRREGREDVAVQLLEEESRHYPGLAGFSAWLRNNVKREEQR